MTTRSTLAVAFLVLLLAVPPFASAATITVTSTADTIAVDGAVTLREAITSIDNGADVNADVASSGAYGTNDTIRFNIPGAGVQTIVLTSVLPTISKPTLIDGYSQPGTSANTLANGDNAVLLINLDASGLPGAKGLNILSDNCTVQGLIIIASRAGIIIDIRGNGNVIAGNFLGLNPAGTSAAGGGPFAAVEIDSGSGNMIGGTTPAARNVMGAADVCLGVYSPGTTIQGNFIGTNKNGTAAIGCTSDGMEIAAVANTVVGGTVAGARNVIAASGDGIRVTTTGANNTVIQGNFIGTDVTGTLPLGNLAEGIGVDFGTTNTTIGGTAPGAANVIAFNGGPGVGVTGSAIGASIRANSIFSNTGLGIDLAEDGVTANDACDADTGPNHLQNFPVLTTASSGGGSTTVQGTLNSTASTTFHIDFFSNPSCAGSGHGQGKTFLGSTDVTTDASCNATINVSLPVSVPAGSVITATATNPANETSEFSACVAVPGALLPSSTSLVSSPNPSTVGQAVTFTATVTGSGATPAGSVTFMEGATSLGTATLSGSGQATFTTASLTAGNHAITAVFAGSATYSASTSPVVTQVVNAAAAVAPVGAPTLDLWGLIMLGLLLAVAGRIVLRG